MKTVIFHFLRVFGSLRIARRPRKSKRGGGGRSSEAAAAAAAAASRGGGGKESPSTEAEMTQVRAEEEARAVVENEKATVSAWGRSNE